MRRANARRRQQARVAVRALLRVVAAVDGSSGDRRRGRQRALPMVSPAPRRAAARESAFYYDYFQNKRITVKIMAGEGQGIRQNGEQRYGKQ